MRNLHKYVKEKYGLEALHYLRLWEKGVVKESNYKNHRIFTLRCISNKLVPVSVSLRSPCSKLSQGARKIIERAERQLLQDRVRGINKTIEDSGNSINNNKTKFASLITNEMDFAKCSKFIKELREDRYGKVKDRWVRKFHNLINKRKNINNRLEQDGNAINNRLSQVSNAGHSDSHNNNTNNQLPNSNNSNSKWVINLSKTSLTEGQKSILAKEPNFSLAPKYIRNVDYITAVESMCSKLREDEAMELRTDINVLLRKSKVPKSNITKEERIGLSQLKKDKDRVILTADKGVTMVVMDKEEYVSKAQELLEQPEYRSIPSDPTNKIKAQLITKLRRIKREKTWMRVHIRLCILLVAFPLSFMDYLKSIKQAIP